MRNGEAGDVTEAAGELAAAPEAPESLGWDGIGVIAILLVAAVSLHDRVSAQSVAQFLHRALWWVIYLVAATRLLRQCGTEWLRWTVRQQPALCVLLALTFASCLWSLDPPLTLQKATSLLCTTMVGVFIGYTCPPQRFMRVLHWTFTLLIVSSIVVSLVLPIPVVEGQPMGWRGIMGQKNSLGAAAVWATIFFLVLTLKRRIHPLWGATLCTLSLFALAQARSRTSFAALGVSLVACVYLTTASATRRPTRALLRRLSLGLVLAVSVIPFLVAPLATGLGDNDPFDGRLILWEGALTILRERPLTGYGYAVVWGRSDATLLPHIAITANRSATNAHNGIVNVATELGIPAAIIACVYLFGALSNAGQLFGRKPSAFSFFALVFLIAFAVMNFAEAHLLAIHWFFWVLFVALTVTVRRSLNGTTPTARNGTAK